MERPLDLDLLLIQVRKVVEVVVTPPRLCAVVMEALEVEVQRQTLALVEEELLMVKMGYLVVQEELDKVVQLDCLEHKDSLLVVAVQEQERHLMVEKVEVDLVVGDAPLEEMANLTQEVVVVAQDKL